MLSVDQATQIVETFRQQYPSVKPLAYVIKATQQEIYGDHTAPEIAGRVIHGNYFPHQQAFAIAAANASSADELRRTLRHELLGHCGINTCSPIEKRALLDAIVAGRSEPSLAEIWQAIDENYADVPDGRPRAEEVYATVCQEIQPEPRHDRALGAQVLRETVRTPTLAISRERLTIIATFVAEGMHDGTRTVQIVPPTDHDQFRAGSASCRGASSLLPPLPR